MAGDEFAGLLRELKERSGLSYGVLGKRLHVSASTLHRYVNGDAVPTDYAPVERLARLCKASPEELLELHRRWVQADGQRGRKGVEAEPDSSGEVGAGPVSSGEAVAGVSSAEVVAGPVSSGEASPVSRRRRTAVVASVAVAAVVASAALAAQLVPDGGGAHGGKREAVGATASSVDSGPGDGASADVKRGEPSATASHRGSPTVSASATSGEGEGEGEGASAGKGAAVATAPAVATNPYRFEGPCSQHYLVNRKPAQVPPPPSEQDARGWVVALGGVAGQDQMLALTVQGTGKATVVLEALHVHMVRKGAPLVWNDYAMGVGCGGDVSTKSFDVNLDTGRPDVTPKDGQRDFPYKVSESDPEVFYVTAHAQAHDVSWFLELDWSSGKRHGTVRVDDNGQPFRTSGNAGRPAYDYPLGGSEWETAPAG